MKRDDSASDQKTTVGLGLQKIQPHTCDIFLGASGERELTRSSEFCFLSALLQPLQAGVGHHL